MILSRGQIEAIGEAVIQDFEQNCRSKYDSIDEQMQNATSIEQFAADYLGLDVSMTELSPDGSICGLTAYTDTKCRVSSGGTTRILQLHRKMVLLDSHLAGPYHTGRRRFTLAHECAHQILFSMEDEATRRARKTVYARCASYSLRELKTREDWNEWQANVLAAAILIPIGRLKQVRCQLAQTEPIKCYGPKLEPSSHIEVEALSNIFCVSKTAMLIRLRQIGAVVDRPESEYRSSSLDIWP